MKNIQNLILTTFLLTQENLVLMIIFTFTPLLFPWKLLWCNLNKQFYLLPLAYQLQRCLTENHCSKYILSLHFVGNFKIFVLSLNRNNFTTIVRGVLVLLSLLLCFTRCARSISVLSNPSFYANISWTFSSQSFHVSPFVSFIPSILILFRRDLSSNSVSLSWAYIHEFLGYHYLAFPFFFLRYQSFPLSCFA